MVASRAASAPSAATPATVRAGWWRGFVARDLRVFAGFSLECAPVSNHIGSIAVNLEPGDGLWQHRTMEQSPLRSRRSLRVQEAGLESEDLLQPLDVASGDRQQTQFDPSFERVGREPSSCDQPERM